MNIPEEIRKKIEEWAMEYALTMVDEDDVQGTPQLSCSIVGAIFGYSLAQPELAEYELNRKINLERMKEQEKEIEQLKEQLRLCNIDQLNAETENEQLREAASELVHLHACEQEGLESGKPTFAQWIEAVENLSKLLTPKPKSHEHTGGNQKED